MDYIRLLEFLSDGEFHSGVEMGAALGVSRTAVWKALGRLESDGVALEVIKGKGYRINGGLDLLNRDVILDCLGSRSISLEHLCVLQEVDSTNSYLMRGDFDVKGYTLCLAERQMAGRGRRGRSWHSPYAKNLYMSISFGLSGGGDVLDGLSLALGVAVARCLVAQGVKDVGLKWPNDVWVGGRKLAGILVELKGEAEYGWKIVAGLGVNVHMSEDEGGVVGQPWTSINAEPGVPSISRSVWSALLTQSLIETIENYRVSGLNSILDDWAEFDILCGREVLVSGKGQSGICGGIDHKGRLLINNRGKVDAINAGEVSVRPNDSSS